MNSLVSIWYKLIMGKWSNITGNSMPIQSVFQ